MTASKPIWVLQFCHGYDGPFLDCARQYAALFAGTRYKVCTVYLTGEPSEAVRQGSASDEVIFFGYSSAEVRGLKLRAIADLKCLVASRDFRLCIAHRGKPIYIALLGSKLPVIGVHHAFDDYQRLSRRLFANAFKRRLWLLGVSDAVRDDIRARLPGWPTERIGTLYNRLDIATVQGELVSPEVARTALGLPSDVWVVGNAGRLHPDKDQATLLHGFAAALPGLPAGSVLAIMGRGRLEASLKALAVELGVGEQVYFLGQVADGRRYFRAFDCFALSSDHEPFGMVLVEAMAAHLPLICTDCGGGREVVEGVGELFPLGDSQGLAQALQRVARLDDAARAACVARMMQRLQTRFSDQAVARDFWSLPLLGCL